MAIDQDPEAGAEAADEAVEAVEDTVEVEPDGPRKVKRKIPFSAKLSLLWLFLIIFGAIYARIDRVLTDRTIADPDQGLPILQAGEEIRDEEDGQQSSIVEWDDKERHKWLKFLVSNVTGEDKHVTFADFVMLCDWNEVKAGAPFKDQREKGEHVWVVATEVAELLIGKFETMKQAFTAISRDRYD